MHGIMTAVMYLQSALAILLPIEIHSNDMWWLDDIVIHALTVHDHLKALSMLF